MLSKLTSQASTFSTFRLPAPKGRTRVSASASRSRMFSTIPSKRGWQPNTSRAPAACRALAIYQANPTLSPTPVTSANWPLKSSEIMLVLAPIQKIKVIVGFSNRVCLAD
jgi:hypothetical protein